MRRYVSAVALPSSSIGSSSSLLCGDTRKSPRVAALLLRVGIGAPTSLAIAMRGVIVPNQLKAYGDQFSPSTGDRSDHLAGHLVLQKAVSIARGDSPLRRVRVHGEEDFLSMGLPPLIVNKVLQETLGISVPSPIQQTSIQPILQRKDVLLAAQNGEGKTVAYLAPLYANMLKDRDVYKIPLRERRPRMILMAPTRELSDQLQLVCSKFDAATGLKSSSFTSKKRAAFHLNRILKSGKHDVLILHPRVVLKLVRARRLFLDDLRYVSIDEADVMCSSLHDHDAVHLMMKVQKRNMYKHLWPVQTQFVFSTSFVTRKLEYLLGRKFPRLVPTFRHQSLHTASPTIKQRFLAIRRESEKVDTLWYLLRRYGHRETSRVDTDESQLRAATVFTPVAGKPIFDGRAADLAAGGQETGELCAMEEDEGVERRATKVPSSSTDVSPVTSLDLTAAGAAEYQQEHRFLRERVTPTSWGHLTTVAAPFTAHVPLQQYSGAKRTVIFFKGIDACIALYHHIKNRGYSCALVHGALPVKVRNEMFCRFASGECEILCTTDLLSRGLDMHVDVVINFDMPTNAIAYLSRVGRVGRMGRKGDVVSLYTKHQATIVNAIRTFAKGGIPLHEVSNGDLHMNRPRYQDWRKNKINAISRSYVSMITTKTIPAHLERTYLRHNATWRPIYRPETAHIHGGVPPRQQAKIMEKVVRAAVDYRRAMLSKRKRGRAKFGSHVNGRVWNTVGGVASGPMSGASPTTDEPTH